MESMQLKARGFTASFSSNIISADSFAMSTAVSTEIPTSEFISEGLSLMPSPI